MENNTFNQSGQGGQAPVPPPESHLVWAILSTVLCCLPFGIVSIVYASKVDGYYMQGFYQQAQVASNKAKTWALVSAVSALLIWVIYFVCFVAFGAAAGLLI